MTDTALSSEDSDGSDAQIKVTEDHVAYKCRGMCHNNQLTKTTSWFQKTDHVTKLVLKRTPLIEPEATRHGGSVTRSCKERRLADLRGWARSFVACSPEQDAR